MFDISGKKALVTGASKGIGRSIALSLAQQGVDLLIAARNEEELQRLSETIKAKSVNCSYIVADLAKYEDVLSLARQALSIYPTIDILVNNAGVSYPEPALETQSLNWDKTFGINVKALFFLAQQLVAPMIKQSYGRIINISSQAGLIALENHAAYCASKGAVEMVSKVMALEWAEHGVTVNCVAPTVINTPMAEMAFPTPEAKAKMLSKIPVGRFGEVEEVAAAVIYLASKEAAMVTGDTLKIDGGWLVQ